SERPPTKEPGARSSVPPAPPEDRSDSRGADSVVPSREDWAQSAGALNRDGRVGRRNPSDGPVAAVYLPANGQTGPSRELLWRPRSDAQRGGSCRAFFRNFLREAPVNPLRSPAKRQKHSLRRS